MSMLGGLFAAEGLRAAVEKVAAGMMTGAWRLHNTAATFPSTTILAIGQCTLLYISLCAAGMWCFNPGGWLCRC